MSFYGDIMIIFYFRNSTVFSFTVTLQVLKLFPAFNHFCVQ